MPAIAGDGGAEALPPPPPPPPAAGAADIYCAASGGIVAPALCDRISMVKSRLRPGSAAYNVPQSMVVGQTATVRLSMNRQAGSAAPAAAVGTLDGRTVTFAPMVGQFMRAELSASPSTAFVIKASRAERQDLGAADSAVWEWSVTAKEEGRPRLIVRTWVVLNASSETPVSITENPDQIVAVTVTPKQRWLAGFDDAIMWLGKGTNLLKALGALIAAAGAVWLAVRKLRAS